MAGKTYRFYYNRSIDFPQIFSVDEGDSSTEINVVGLVCEVTSEFRFIETADNEKEPRAFMIAYGKLEIDKGVAYIRKV